jgi:CRP/FNR family transcriptional regulator, cyclic AMP receptor protein
VLGLAAVISGTPHLTTAQVTLPSVVALLRLEHLAGAMRKHPQLSEAVAQSLAMECKECARDMLLLRVPCSSSQRLAAVLVCLGDGRGSAMSRQLALTYTHAELGQLIGATRETVTRLMNKFERQGVIKTTHSTFQVTDPRALKEIGKLS